MSARVFLLDYHRAYDLRSSVYANRVTENIKVL